METLRETLDGLRNIVGISGYTGSLMQRLERGEHDKRTSQQLQANHPGRR
jgi:hypothetical protein